MSLMRVSQLPRACRLLSGITRHINEGISEGLEAGSGFAHPARSAELPHTRGGGYLGTGPTSSERGTK